MRGETFTNEEFVDWLKSNGVQVTSVEEVAGEYSVEGLKMPYGGYEVRLLGGVWFWVSYRGSAVRYHNAHGSYLGSYGMGDRLLGFLSEQGLVGSTSTVQEVSEVVEVEDCRVAV